MMQIELKQALVKAETLDLELSKANSLLSFYQHKAETLANQNQQLIQQLFETRNSIRETKDLQQRQLQGLLRTSLAKREEQDGIIQRLRSQLEQRGADIERLNCQKKSILEHANMLANINDKLRYEITMLEHRMSNWHATPPSTARHACVHHPPPKKENMSSNITQRKGRRQSSTERSIQTSQFQTRVMQPRQQSKTNQNEQQQQTRKEEREAEEMEIRRLVSCYESLVKQF